MPITSLLKPEIKTWLQKSIESELYAHFLYSQIANELQRLGYFGAEKYFRNESNDEFEHYGILINFLNDMGDIGKIPVLPPINATITSIGDAINLAYQTELSLLRQYEDFYKESEDDYDDFVTAQFLLQFLKIQSDSVGEFGDFISRYEKNPTDVYEFDEYLQDQVK